MHVTLALHTSRAPRVTRNTSIFYEIKKPSKIGGLILVAPKEDAVYFRNFWAVSNVMRYIHMGVSPIMPVEPEALRLLHT